MFRSFRVAVAFIVVLLIVLSTDIARAAAAVPPGWRDCPAVTYTVTGGTEDQGWAVARSIEQVSMASGQLYAPAPAGTAAALVIVFAYPPPGDEGWTSWWAAGPADVTLSPSMTPDQTQSMAMHELMLSRHLLEVDDAGGLLGHWVPLAARYYGEHDQAVLRAAPCV